MAEKRPDQLPAITGMSDTDIFIIQKNISDPNISNRTVGQIEKGNVGFLPVSGGTITNNLNVSGYVNFDKRPYVKGTGVLLSGEADSISEETIRYSIPSGAATSDISFSTIYNSVPFVIGSFHLSSAANNFYAINITNITTSGCKIIYSADIEETGNNVNLLVKDL